MGLFIATSAFGNNGTTPYGIATTQALTLACKSFNATTSPNRITSIALDHLVGRDGVYLEETLDNLAQYFPCFDTVYIGTADNHNAPDIYCSSLLNTSFTDDYVSRSLIAAKRFTDTYSKEIIPNMVWYLNYEAAGNYFGTGCDTFQVNQPTTKSDLPNNPIVSAESFTHAYATMFHQLTTGLMKLRNTNGAMWSPTFNWRSDFVKMIMNRKALLGNVTSLLESVPLIREIANQDALGKYSLYNISSRSFTYNLTCQEDTIFYQRLLKDAAEQATTGNGEEPAVITVNMELFSRRNTVPIISTITGDPMEHVKEESVVMQRII